MPDKRIKVGKRWVTQEEADELLKPKYFDPSKKTFAILKRKSSPHFVAFQVDDIDDGEEWFIACLTVKNSSKEIVHSSTLIAKDMPGWIKSYENMSKFIKV